MAADNGSEQRRAEHYTFLIGSVGPFIVLLVVVVAFAGTGFSDNAKLWNWLQLASLPTVVALLPMWMRYHRHQRMVWIPLSAGLSCLFIVLEIGSYLWNWDTWTAFKGHDLWDWLSFVLLPFVLALALAWAAAESALPQPATSVHSATTKLPIGTSRPPRPVGADALARSVLLVGGALVLVLLAVWLVPAVKPASQGGATRGSPTAAGRSAPPSASPSEPNTGTGWTTYRVIVPGTAPWTSTDLMLQRGQAYVVHASGQVSFIGGGPLVGPDGDTNPHPGVCVLPGAAHHAALIGRINATDLGVPFLVGGNFAGVAEETGMLVLGINDVGVDNNAGAFTADIEIEKVSTPAATGSG